MRNRVVVTGLGCVSPVGNDVKTSWNNLVAGKSGATRITKYDAADFKSQIAAEVKEFDGDQIFGRKDARRMDLYSQYGMAAALEALENSGLQITDSNRDRIGAIIGSGIGGLGTIEEQMQIMLEQGPTRVSPFLIPMMLPDTCGGLLAIHLGIRASNLAVISACATGTNAIGEAAEYIRRGWTDVMFAGGAEAAVIRIAMAGMASMTALTTRNDEPERASRPFDADRDGFLMGEGSAILILESLDHALARGANIICEVSGYGSTNDAYHITAPAEEGAGAVKCMTMALDDAGLKADEISYVNAHGTSTPLNDRNETAAIKTVMGEAAYEIPVSSTKSMTGHMLGASGAFEALVCVKAIQDQTMPPTINYETPDPDCDLDYVPNEARKAEIKHTMSNSFGFGGHNATILMSAYEPEETA